MVEIRASDPVRTCVGCRQRAAKRDLLRVTLQAGEVVPDPKGNAAGRGAHLHPTVECLAAAERRRAFARALRSPGGIALGLDRLREQIDRLQTAGNQENPSGKPQEMEH